MMIQTDPVLKFEECSEKGKLEEIRFRERTDSDRNGQEMQVFGEQREKERRRK